MIAPELRQGKKDVGVERLECEDQREIQQGDAREEENEQQPLKKRRLKGCEPEVSKAGLGRDA